MATKKTTGTELAPAETFAVVNRFEGMDPELLEELKDELADLDSESGIDCRLIKIPAGGGLAYEIQGDNDDVSYAKEISGVIVFTHRMNGYWPGSYGTGDSGEDKIPLCSSMDGKTGLQRETGEARHCDTCPLNQFGSADDGQGKGKACKNMRRLYLMLNNDPNIYLLTVPPTSIKDVNRHLVKIMGSGVPYTGMIVGLKLEKAVNVNGVAYSKVVLEKKGLLPPAASVRAQETRRQVKEQYQNLAITMDDYIGVPQVDAAPAPANAENRDFVEAAADEDEGLPF